MLHRATSTLSHLALIGLALLALAFSTIIWLYEEIKSRVEQGRVAHAYEITPQEPASSSLLGSREVSAVEGAASAND